MILSIFIEFCNHQHKQSKNIFIMSPPPNSHNLQPSFFFFFIPLPSPSPRKQLIYSLSLQISLFGTFHISKSYMWSFVTSLFHCQAFKFHPCCSMYPCFIYFYCLIKFHRIEYTTLYLFIIDGNISHFHFGATTNNALVNNCLQDFFMNICFISLGYIPE